MIYQTVHGVINVESLEDISGWMSDDIYMIATDLLNREISERDIEISSLDSKVWLLEEKIDDLNLQLKKIKKYSTKVLTEIESSELSKMQLLKRVTKIINLAEKN